MPEIAGASSSAFTSSQLRISGNFRSRRGKGDQFDADFPTQRVGTQKPQFAHPLDVGRQRYLFLFDQEKLILANVLSAELIGRFSEVFGKLGNGVQVNPDRGRRVVTDLEDLPASVVEVESRRNSFRCDHITKRAPVGTGKATYLTQPTCRRLSSMMHNRRYLVLKFYGACTGETRTSCCSLHHCLPAGGKPLSIVLEARPHAERWKAS